MEKFPSWMKMAKDETSIGAQFLDVFGLTFAEVKKELDETVANFYLETANVEMIDFLYKVSLATKNIPDLNKFLNVEIENFNGSLTQVAVCPSLRAFYQIAPEQPFRAYYDTSNQFLYLRLDKTVYPLADNPFQAVVVNQTKQYDLLIHPVWNAFDEFALLLGLSRFHLEDNEALKKRILDVFLHPGNSTPSGIKAGLARELGIKKEDISIHSLADKDYLKKLTTPEGKPTKQLMAYARQINETLRFTYDEMNFGEAYWFSIEQENLGLHYLPHVWDIDASVFQKEDFQSGVGGEEDLKLFAPEKQDSTRAFQAYVGLMGTYEQSEELYPELSFRYKIYAKGKVPNKKYKEEAYKYTVQASELVTQPFLIHGEQHFTYNHRIDFFEPEKLFGEAGLQYLKSNDFLHKETDGLMKMTVRLHSTDENTTPLLPELKVIYETTDGEEDVFVFNTSDKWLNQTFSQTGIPLTQVRYSDIFIKDNQLGLGLGEFYQEYDTTADFQSGTYETNSILVQNGKITLNLDTLGYTQN